MGKWTWQNLLSCWNQYYKSIEKANIFSWQEINNTFSVYLPVKKSKLFWLEQLSVIGGFWNFCLQKNGKLARYFLNTIFFIVGKIQKDNLNLTLFESKKCSKANMKNWPQIITSDSRGWVFGCGTAAVWPDWATS